MIWDDVGFLLSKNRYNENSLISEIYTKDHGKVTGIIFGGTSKRLKNYLQIGNKIHVNFNTKSEGRIGYFKTEIQEATSALYFDNQQKLACISSGLNLVRILSADSQKNKSIYDLLENFYDLLKNENWIKNYVYWELELFKILGYDLDFKNLVSKQSIGNHLQYFSNSSIEKKIIPNFLVDKNNNYEDLGTLLKGFKIVGDYLDKTILKPNNLSHPNSRLYFINTLK
tara:strand:- start:1016 stop:1696 length:681 start_codon:yes stop_codon:yes gene_type:complete